MGLKNPILTNKKLFIMTYAFETYVYCNELQISALYEGNSADAFALRHYRSGSFAVIHYGGQEIKEKYDALVEELNWSVSDL
jgi:hypothetical protein